MDRAGRIVIPKELRDRLGLQPDSELELQIDGTGFRAELADWQGRAVERAEDGRPILARVEDREFTPEDVQKLRDELQR